MSKPVKVVLDTNIFVNPDSFRLFGANPIEALRNVLNVLAHHKMLTCYIPPSVFEELMKFMEGAIMPESTVCIEKRPPASYENTIPALLFYEFIEEMRLRINKGLRVAEKFSRKGLQGEPEETLIKSLREEHRVAMREGIIDSKEDFDLILLAKELGAHLATVDNGLVKWAQKLGIPCIGGNEFKKLLQAPE
ncbi:MAG: RNA ligase partner protein [Candidatus Omnitrophota bacterium]|nr:RNA ligase partner protein [Candidatus Omnitrophota bacterium]